MTTDVAILTSHAIQFYVEIYFTLEKFSRARTNLSINKLLLVHILVRSVKICTFYFLCEVR